MKPPQSLIKHLAAGKKLDDAPDEALVKMGTLRAMIARVIAMIPSPAGGLSVRRSLYGDVWNAEPGEAAHPLTLKQTSNGHFTITAGSVNGVAVRQYSDTGDEISNDDPPDFAVTNGYIYLGINWTLSYDTGYLVDASDPVPFIATASSLPAEDPSDGEFVVMIANIYGGDFYWDFSPKKNLWCICRPLSASGGDTAQIALA
jgi:hypothetical protein